MLTHTQLRGGFSYGRKDPGRRKLVTAKPEAFTRTRVFGHGLVIERERERERVPVTSSPFQSERIQL